MYSLRRRSGTTEPEPAADHDADAARDADADAAQVRSFVDTLTAACIDLIDLPLDHATQRRVVELLLHGAPAAEQAITRLNAAAVPQ